jgi:hypothetical protein
MRLNHDASVTRAFERIETLPFRIEACRFEDLNWDLFSLDIEHEPGEAEVSSPSGVVEVPADDPGEPAAGEVSELLVIGSARREGAIHRQPREMIVGEAGHRSAG